MRLANVLLGCVLFVWGANGWAQTPPSSSSSTSSQPPIVIGQVLPLTGPLAAVGRDIEQATRAHFEWANSRGGVAGRRLELVTLDDGNDPKLHAAAVATLVNERNVTALLSCFGTVGCMAGANAAKVSSTPLVGPIAGASALRASDVGRVFPVRPSATLEVARLVEFSERIGLKRVALFVQDDGFGRGYLNAAEEAFKARNLSPVAKIVFSPAAPDYAALASQMVAAKVEAVVMLANVGHSAAMIKAMRATGGTGGSPYFLNLAGQANGAFVKALSGQSALAAFAAFTPNPWSERVALAKEYREAWQKTVKDENFSFLSLEAYVNAKLLTTALGRSTRPLTRESLAQAIGAMRDTDLGGFSVGFPAGQRDASTFVDLAVMVKSGRFVQ